MENLRLGLLKERLGEITGVDGQKLNGRLRRRDPGAA
jgi:hypothetical protein